MSNAYTTPGVYVEERPTLPPSVAEVPTAIPAFIGYTQKLPPNAVPNEPHVARVSTLLEYVERFGGAAPAKFTVRVAQDGTIVSVARDQTAPQFLLYYAIRQFFANGGGSCYIASAGVYGSAIVQSDLEKALTRLAREDEPTLLLLTDATQLDSVGYYALCDQALQQCQALGDRFALFDVPGAADAIKTFRDGVSSYLSYGAAYTPYLQTSQSYVYENKGVSIEFSVAVAVFPKAMEVTYTAPAGSTSKAVALEVIASGTEITFAVVAAKLTIQVPLAADAATGKDIVAAWNARKKQDVETFGFDITVHEGGAGTVEAGTVETLAVVSRLDKIQTTNTALYNRIQTRLTQERVVLPPTSSVAGVYASVDRDRGVWKAPANVAVAGVIGPIQQITDEEQGRLNVDPTSGKSINALRAFTGKGTLVWGARTLLGNDNEWRYIPVRRLFILIEESARKATSFAVFEPNVLTTWLKVKGMIESFLYSLWERGALAGATPEAAYFVNVGLGTTMTTQDILEGRMNVDIGVAAVRPAEFIVLRFTHKLQEA